MTQLRISYCQDRSCVHGAEFTVNKSKMLVCTWCSRLFNLDELTKLEPKKGTE